MFTFLLTVARQDEAYRIGYVMGYMIGAVTMVFLMVAIPAFLIFSVFKYGKTNRKKWLIGAILSGIPIVIFVVLICAGTLIRAYRGIESDLHVSDQGISQSEVLPLDGNSVSVRIPSHWTLLNNLNDVAVFQAGNLRREEYVIAIRYSKIDYIGGLEALSGIVVQEILENVDDSEVVSTEKIQISGSEAYQKEVSGILDNLKVLYLSTVFETPDYYYQIVGWTLQSRKEAAFPVIKEVVTSITFESSKRVHSDDSPTPDAPDDTDSTLSGPSPSTSKNTP